MADVLGADADDSVNGEEWLYRRVNPLKVDKSTGRPLSQAFGPIENGMSVDRAKLCNNDPAHVQQEATDYVCSATAEAVRDIKIDRRDEKGRIIETHRGEVTATPKVGNDAHADVHEERKFPKPNNYKRLKASLAQTFSWEHGFSP